MVRKNHNRKNRYVLTRFCPAGFCKRHKKNRTESAMVRSQTRAAFRLFRKRQNRLRMNQMFNVRSADEPGYICSSRRQIRLGIALKMIGLISKSRRCPGRWNVHASREVRCWNRASGFLFGNFAFGCFGFGCFTATASTNFLLAPFLGKCFEHVG